MTAPDRVFASRALRGATFEKLRESCEVEIGSEPGSAPPDRLAARLATADGLLCLLTDRVDAGLLGACPRLREISSVSVVIGHSSCVLARRPSMDVISNPAVGVGPAAGIDKRLTQREAARMLGLTTRQMRRLQRAYTQGRPVPKK